MPALWETDADTGRRLMAWYDQGSIFMVTRSFEVYQELERLNRGLMCCWISASTPTEDNVDSGGEDDNADDGDPDDGDDGEEDSKSVSTVRADPIAPDIGVICLHTPRFFYEKMKAGLPTCFLFGRQSAGRKVDVCLGRSSKIGLSRIHFAVGLKNGIWAVRHMCPTDITTVNGQIDLIPATPSCVLWPGRVNTIQVADIKLEIYCRDQHDTAPHLRDEDYYLPLVKPLDKTESSGTSLTTVAGALPTHITPPMASRIYMLEERTLPSRTPVKKFLAMDAWTSALYTIKEYPFSKAQQDMLNSRLALLRSLPVSEKLRSPRSPFLFPFPTPTPLPFPLPFSPSCCAHANMITQLDGPFIRDESVGVLGETLSLLSRHREDIYTLGRFSALATVQLSRMVLRALLKTVALLHQFNIVHNDICLSTVFVAGVLDDGTNPDDILLSGFSEASSDMTRAKSDCYQVFRTVKEFLGQHTEAPRCWTGDALLDDLWHRFLPNGSDSWPYTAQEVCRLSDISLSPNPQEPKAISVTKDFSFKHTSRQDVSYLDVEDVKNYLTKDAVRCAGKAPSSSQVKALIQKAFAALEPCTSEGRITTEDYGYFMDHMSKRHSNFSLGLELSMSLPNEYYIKKPIQFTLRFPVPCFSRYGLINLEYLHHLGSPGFYPNSLKPLLQHCFEVRGFPEARGVYISIAHLDVVAERLGLRVEDEYDAHAADTSLDDYTYQNWYLLAPNPMAKIFPVNRKTDQVLTCSSPPAYTPLQVFLEDHFEPETILDLEVTHDPEKLFVDESTEPLQHSCEGSVEAHSGDLFRFRFSNQPKPSLLLEAKQKRKAETDAWIEQQEAERRNRDRQSRDVAEASSTAARTRARSESTRGHISTTEFASNSPGRR